MTDKEFDDKVRKLCSDFEEMPSQDLWKGVESSLNPRRRILFRRRWVVPAAAAAILLFWIWSPDPEADRAPVADDSTAVSPVPGGLREAEVLSEPSESIYVSDAPMRAVAFVQSVHDDVMDVPDVMAVPEVRSVDVLPSDDAPADMPSSASDSYTVEDYAAFAEERDAADSRITLSVFSDLYTIFGTGNVNFTTRSMSGGSSSGGGTAAVKPLNGVSPHHDFPLSAGIDVQYGFGSLNSFGQHRFGVGAGVSYTCLRSSYQALVSREYLGKYGQGSEEASVVQTVHYLGIPLSFSVNVITTDKLFFYVSAGGVMEKGIQHNYRFTDISGDVSYKSLPVSGLQWSVNMGLGFEYRFLDFMGLYADPRLTYFFDCRQPYSIREEQRLQLNLGLGFRFHF